MAKQIPLPKKYTIPDNWKWIELEKLTSMRCGFPFDSSRFSDDHKGRKPLIRIRDVVRGETTTYTDEECQDEYIIHYGDVLIGMDGDFNVAKWKSEDALLNQRVCYICTASDVLLNDYLFYYLPDPLKKINDATPSVTVKHLSTKTLGKTSIPLPPIAEQQRIVERIESLFAKLDEAKEKAQTVVDGFEDRKAAILHKAFTGELTAEWRDRHGLLHNEWRKKRLDEFAEIVSGFAFSSSDFKETNCVPCIKITNVGVGEFNGNDYEYLPAEYLSKYERFNVKRNDILISLTRSYIASGLKVCIYPDDGMALLNQRVALIRNCNIKYAFYYLTSESVLNYVKEKSKTTNQPNLSIKDLCSLTIPVPTKHEQLEIAVLLDSLLDREKQAKEAAEQVIDQIDAMKKAILARAFRGELGTNDPSDESADEL